MSGTPKIQTLRTLVSAPDSDFFYCFHTHSILVARLCYFETVLFMRASAVAPLRPRAAFSYDRKLAEEPPGFGECFREWKR